MGNGQSLIKYDPENYKDDLVLELNPMSYPNYGNYTMKNVDLKELIGF
jgi:hypothetical protein